MGSGHSNFEHRGKLNFSRSDDAFIKSVIQFLEGIVKEYHRESEVPFKNPLIWTSSLPFSSFVSLKSPEYNSSDDRVVSTSQLKDGNPVLEIEKTNDGPKIKVWSLKSLYIILSCATEGRTKEARQCLEANSDTTTLILGPAFADAGPDTVFQIRERLTKEGSGEDIGDIEARFRLSLLINNLDLMASVTQQGEREVNLRPASVDREVKALRSSCGEERSSCLKRIDFTPGLVFANGCRAPPWHQLDGDICYISVVPWDTEPLCITANIEGYFESKSNGVDIRPERVGTVYQTLVSLLEAKSQIFANHLKKEGIVSFQDDEDRAHSSGQRDQDSFLLISAGKQQLNVVRKDGRPETRNKKTREPATPRRRSADTSRSKAKSMSSFRSMDDDDDESESSESDNEEEELPADRRPESTADLPSEYWQIQKLIKYLKGGNQTATVISLCLLLDFDLTQEASHLAIRDNGGLDTLINLLETEDIKCKIGTLRILKIISTNSQTRTAIVDLKGLPHLVETLQSDIRELKCLAAETIANIAKFKRARRIVRAHNGLQYLTNQLGQVDMLDKPGRPGSPISGERPDIEVARCAAQGLWSCSRSRRNKMALLKTNVVPLLGNLLQSDEEAVLIPVVGTLQECASEPTYQAIIRSKGMVEHLVKGLHMESTELKMHCAAAIFKCAEDNSTRELVHRFDGLSSLTKLLAAAGNKELLTAATGAIWKCSKSPAIVQQLKQLKAVEKLVTLITDQPEEVQINVVGAIGECAAQDSENRVIIRKAGGITPLVQLLTGTNQPLLINTTKAVGACALENESMIAIDRQDGVRLLWSLLKSPNPEVQACAAWALCPCIQNAKDAGELVRSFVGGLELIVGLLKADNIELLASVCAAIAKIAQDEENLAVITDHGVVSMLARLTDTSDDKLRHHLADAIAKCCSWRNNRVGFGQNDAVAPLVEYLQSSDPLVHQTTACALYQLSKNPENCITMHEAGVVKLLLPMVGSRDAILQEAAAGCISNIRHLALANEKAKHR